MRSERQGGADDQEGSRPTPWAQNCVSLGSETFKTKIAPGVAAEKRKREKAEAGPGEKPPKKGRAQGKAKAKPKAKAAAAPLLGDGDEWPSDDEDAWTDGDEITADGLE